MRRSRCLILQSAIMIALACWLLAPRGVFGQTQPTSSTPAERSNHTNHANNRETFVLVGAGDIASCKSLEGAEATAKLIESIPGDVFAAGDLAYEKGTAEEFKNCYDKTWGRFKSRTHPAPGNHEFYGSKDGSPYFEYWGTQAGPAEKGYYSFDLGNWHVIALNTNCGAPGLGGCDAGSPQDIWLQKDLAEHAKSCIVAFGHHALYSSGVLRSHAIHPELRQLWQDLYQAHADLMLNGHEHSYERFAPQDVYGNLDEKRGIREIVVGTGGRNHDPLGFATANSEVRNAETFGVLKLTLSPGKYTWEFVPVEGGAFHDSGEGACHNEKAPR
ncbi:MAG TPA: metallophosphoesterase [Candidatus Acidoferrum sp.]|nr:metallophosphoesterase [Candidatus Acidoferrum sp.]